MPRSHARILTSIWTDADWGLLSPLAQWMYMLVLSQPGLSHCGVVSYTPKRWTRLAAGVKLSHIEKATAELVEHRFIVVDLDTEELFIRSFVKNDGVLKQPNVVTAMWRAFENVLSEPIRKGFLEGLPEGVHIPKDQGFRDNEKEVFGDGAEEPSRARTRDPLPLSPIPPSSSPSAPPVDDEGGVFARACQALTDRKLLSERVAGRGPTSNGQRWWSTVYADKLKLHRTRADALDLATFTDPLELADELEPESRTPDRAPRPRQLCSDCAPAGWVDNPNGGGVIHCPNCFPMAAPVAAPVVGA